MRGWLWGLLLCLLSAAAQSAETLLLVSPEYPGYVDAKGRGFYVELARALFPPPAYEVRVQIVPFARAVAMVKGGEAQLLPGSNKAGDGLRLSQQATDMDVVAAAVLRERFPDWRGVESLRERKVAAQIGFQYQRYTKVPMHYEERHDLGAMLRMLMLGRLDAVLDYQPRIEAALAQMKGAEAVRIEPAVLLQALHFSFQDSAGGDRLRLAFDAGFQRLQREGRLRALFEAHPQVLRAAYPPALSDRR